jgi:hypothetical protein
MVLVFAVLAAHFCLRVQGQIAEAAHLQRQSNAGKR